MARAFSPRSVAIHEDQPASVASYNLQARNPTDDTVLQTTNYPSAGADTVVAIGTNGFDETLGQDTQFTLQLQEVGPEGDLGDYQPVGDADGHGTFTVRELPNGAESAVVTV